MQATAFLASRSHARPFVRLDDGTYRYLRRNWESARPPVEADGPVPSWVEGGLRSGDVVEAEILRDLTLHLVNRQMEAR